MSQEVTTPNAALPVESQMSDDDILALTRGIRVKVINNLMPGPETPGDNSDRIMLTNMLEGLDRQAMGSKKLKQDQTNNNNTSAVVAEILRTIDKDRAFKLNPGSNTDVIDVNVKVVPSSINDIPALPGEMDVTPPQLDYASFVRSQGKDVDQLGKDVQHAEANDGDDIP